MIALTLAQVAAATGGRLSDPALGDLVVDGPVVTDSRAAGPGGLYVARVGEQADGHAFVADAAAHGAVAALTTRPVAELPYVEVEDIQDGFAALARAVVEAAGDALTVVGVTGSSGKTSTKDLLGQVLGATAPTIAPEGSLNSEVGVPLTVCRIEERTRFLVVEMGARGIGHIAYLTRIAPPRVGVVLNVGTAHLGEFGSRAAIARAKAELVEALPAAAEGGVAVLNADDDVVAAMAARTDARVVLVGESAGAQVRASDIRLDDAGHPSFTVTTSQGSAAVTLAGLVGRHTVGNALAVIAVAQACGIPLAQAVATLSTATPGSRWRMEVSTTAAGVTVVNDAYNANPDSMRAALDALAAMATTGRRVAVLGSMLELGEESAAQHAEIGRAVVERGVDRLVVVGATARPMADAAIAASDGRTEVVALGDADAAYDLLVAELKAGDLVLFKSSRDAGLRLLGDRLTNAEDPS